jgi:nucleoside phosphorylase
MYNLLVTSSAGTWDQVPYEYDYSLERFLEHTEPTLKARFGKLDEDAVTELCSIPTLFMYEQGVEGVIRFGYITNIQKQSGSITFTYKFDPFLSPIDWEKLTPFFAELQIRTRAGEQYRTHWAVKDVDLMRVLKPALGKTTASAVPNILPNEATGNGGKDRAEDPKAQPFDVAVICALHKPELEKVLRTGKENWLKLPTEPSDPQTYYKSTYTTLAGTQLRVIAAAPNQMGPPAAAALAAKMILRFKPRLVAMVGIAAGARTDPTGFGDVLAPDTTLDYTSGKITDSGGKVSFKPDPKPIHINSRLLSLLHEWRSNSRELFEIWNNWQASKPPQPPNLIIGPLASGSSVVANRAVVDDVALHWRKLIGLEMEAYAVHCACRDTVNPETPFLALKAICDFADGSKNDEWQPYAAYVAAELLHRILATDWENLHLKPHPPR